STHYDNTNLKLQEFVKNYTAMFNTPTNTVAYLAYDAAGIFFEAVKEANSFDSDKIVEAIKHLKYQGITGPIEFKGGNDPIKPVYIYGFKGDTPYLVKTVNP
nr:ABC transporter substrate-binding protein [Candidatus Atribacteria bacterium]